MRIVIYISRKHTFLIIFRVQTNTQNLSFGYYQDEHNELWPGFRQVYTIHNVS